MEIPICTNPAHPSLQDPHNSLLLPVRHIPVNVRPTQPVPFDLDYSLNPTQIHVQVVQSKEPGQILALLLQYLPDRLMLLEFLPNPYIHLPKSKNLLIPPIAFHFPKQYYPYISLTYLLYHPLLHKLFLIQKFLVLLQFFGSVLQPPLDLPHPCL